MDRRTTTYRDRRDAGRELAEHLLSYAGRDVLVLGIPRGGLPVAAEVAHRLDADLDIVVARKIGAPDQPELAVGAVTSDGGRFLNTDVLRAVGVSEAELESVTKREMAEARRREQRFRDGRPPARVEGRVVLVVDDGLATGATMRASVRALRKKSPARLVVAVPVGSEEACEALRAEADEVVCPWVPDFFGAVGIFYENFEPTEDDEVQDILRKYSERHSASKKASPAPAEA